MTFQCDLYVPFHLADPAGILFFSHVFSLAHQGYEQLIQKGWNFEWSNWFQNADWVVPIKKAEANFFAPIRAGRNCCIEIAITAVSTSSFTLKSILSQQITCCEVTTVHVFCDRNGKTKIAIPDNIVDLLC